MDPPQQASNLTIEALRHCIEAGELQIDQFKAESAKMCLEMRQTLNNYNTAANALFNSLVCSIDENKDEVDSIKGKFNKMCNTLKDFYEREEKKCFYNTANTFIMDEEDDKDNIVLINNICESLDARIQEYEKIIVQQSQQQ